MLGEECLVDVDTRTLPEHLSNFLEDSSLFQPGGGSRKNTSMTQDTWYTELFFVM